MMFIKPKHWIATLAATLLAALWLILSVPLQASAAPTANQGLNSCFTCHEDLYYLHDTGKSYCLSEHADRCTNCHQGNPAAINEVESHQGLIAHPQANNGEKCGQCHAGDVQARLDTFASVAGYKAVFQASPYQPAVDTTGNFPVVSQGKPFSKNLPWLAGAVTLFGLWLLLVMSTPQKP